MTKWDLIHIAVKELIKQWNNGDNRDFFDVDFEAQPWSNSQAELVIKWEPKVTDDAKNHMNIPKAMKIYRRKGGMFVCAIVDTSPTLLGVNRRDKTIQDQRFFYRFSGLNRDYEKLKNLIEGYKRNKENSIFLNDLVKVFPRTLDGALLGDDYDE